MADAFTQVSSVSTVQTAYQRTALLALREMPVFDQFAKVKPGNVTSPGSAVTFTFRADLALATTALTETVDPDAVALSDSQVTVTPNEYGNAILVTVKVRTDTLEIGFDATNANIVAYNMVDSIDRLARTALDGGTNVDYITGSAETSQVASSIITADQVRQKRAELRGDSTIPWDGSLYVAVIHPDVAYDLKGETGDGSWVAPHQYVDTAAIYNDEVGTFGGFKFVESARAKLNTDGGSSAVDTYTTYFMGQECLAKVESIPAHTVIGPMVDKLMRFRPLGWHTYAGWDTLREAGLRRLISASSIGANA